MDHNVQAHLYDITTACDNIISFTSHLNVGEYSADIRTKAACERMFEIIGEALRRLKAEFPHVYFQIPDADQIIAFRNIIAHGYDIVDDNLVWSIIKNEVPTLMSKCEDLGNT